MLTQGTESLENGPDPEGIVDGFDGRVEAMFRAESGQPLVRAPKRKPLGPGRGNYVRAYSYSMVGFAARCLYLGEMLDEANAALAENAQHYLDNPLDVNDRDSFHWHAEIVIRLIEMYGSRGSKHVGRITKETEALVLKPIWEYTMRTDKFRYTEWHDRKDPARIEARELYDHRQNHDENENVIDSARYAEKAQEMAAKMKAGWRAARPM
jgi:hypothetical protein